MKESSKNCNKIYCIVQGVIYMNHVTCVPRLHSCGMVNCTHSTLKILLFLTFKKQGSNVIYAQNTSKPKMDLVVKLML